MSSFQITYGNVTVGGISDILLHDAYLISLDYDSLDIQFSAIITEASVAAFNAKVALLESEFRKPYQDLTLVIGATTYEFKQSDNTLFDAQPTITKTSNSPANTGLSREYLCRIQGGKPADLENEAAGYVGLIQVSTEVQTAASGQRRVTFSGTYTAQPSGNNAKAQHDAQIGDLRDALLDGVDNSTDWELIDENTVGDRNDRVYQFTRIYQEIVYKQSQTVDDHPSIKDHSMFVQSSEPTRSDSLENVSKPVEVTVGFSASIDKNSTTDLRTLWLTVIRPHMIQTAADYISTPGSESAIISADPGLDPTKNVIKASISLLVYSGSRLLTAIISNSIEITKGFRLVPLFSQVPWEAYVMPSSGRGVLETKYSLIVRGNEAEAKSELDRIVPNNSYTVASVGAGSGINPGSGEAIAPADVPRFALSGGGWLEVNSTEPVSRRLIDSVNLTQISKTIISIYVVPANDEAQGLVR